MDDTRRGVRTILVPADIVAVKRVSPLPVRKRTVWRDLPEGEQVERGGRREWFSDQLFVERQRGHLRALCSGALTVHASCVLGVVMVVAAQTVPRPLMKVGSPLVMPAMLSLMPIAEAASPPPKAAEPSPAKEAPRRPAERPAEAPAGRPAEAPALAPTPAPSQESDAPPETPSIIQPEPGFEPSTEPAVGGVAGGVPGGTGGGTAGGASGGASAGTSVPGPVRLSAGIDPPRKIKDVRPAYPQGALSGSGQARGTVIIEATVGVDGTVRDAKVINSVPLLDQSALEAVRQWEFTPARRNGVPIAVIITVIVQFAIF
jgi:protein TonB